MKNDDSGNDAPSNSGYPVPSVRFRDTKKDKIDKFFRTRLQVASSCS
ncbi:hypothetical protein GF325_06625 [Candidatus Bathyarchaeota archaeon]|nr:hypothetical protein [Candidatus Bathyarchaeota archaeon]